MSVEITELGPCKKRLAIALSRERVLRALERSYQKLARDVVLPGFRRGRVPRRLLERRFGPSVQAALREQLVREALQEAVAEHQLQPIDEPKLELGELDLEADPAFRFEATLQVRPRFELPDLDGIRVERPPAVVTEQDVEEALLSLRRSRARLAARADGEGAEAGDLVLADVELLADGESKQTLEGVHIWTDGERVGPIAVPDLAARLAGLCAGEQVEIPAAFPPRLGIGGSATALRITARKIWRRELPELDDELAAALGAQDVAALRERVRASLQREADRRAEAELDDRILEAVLARVEFELPEDLIQVQLDELALSAQLQAQQHGLSEEEALLEAGKARTSADPVVRQRVKARFLLEALAEREGLSVSEEELARRVTEMALQAGRKPEAYLRELQERGLLGRLRVAMRLEKARAYLREKAEVVDVAAARAGS